MNSISIFEKEFGNTSITNASSPSKNVITSVRRWVVLKNTSFYIIAISRSTNNMSLFCMNIKIKINVYIFNKDVDLHTAFFSLLT